MTKAQIISTEDMTSYQGLIRDLRNETKIPESGTWTYLVRVALLTDIPGEYIYHGSYLYYDGPIQKKSSGPEPTYRRIIYVDKDWEDEHIFDNLGELFAHIRKTTVRFRRFPFERSGDKFIGRDPSTMVLNDIK